MLWFCLHSSSITVDDIKSKSQEKQLEVRTSIHCLSHSASKFFLCAVLTLLNLWWQSAEIRLPYHLGTIYAKWFTLKIRGLAKSQCESFFNYVSFLRYFIWNRIVLHFLCEKTLLNITHDRKGASKFPHSVL